MQVVHDTTVVRRLRCVTVPGRASLASKTTLRCDQASATDTLWALIPDAYVRLVHQSGWTDEQFQAWLADVLERVLLQS